MKGSLRRTIIILFSAMAVLALSTGILVLSGIRQSSSMTLTRTSLADLRLEVKNLQLLRYQVSTIGPSPSIDTATTTAFLTLTQLTKSISSLGKEQTLDGGPGATDLENQLESLRISYLTLLSSYNEHQKPADQPGTIRPYHSATAPPSLPTQRKNPVRS